MISFVWTFTLMFWFVLALSAGQVDQHGLEAEALGIGPKEFDRHFSRIRDVSSCPFFPFFKERHTRSV